MLARPKLILMSLVVVGFVFFAMAAEESADPANAAQPITTDSTAAAKDLERNVVRLILPSVLKRPRSCATDLTRPKSYHIYSRVVNPIFFGFSPQTDMTETSQTHATEQLAGFLTNVTYASLAAPVVHEAKRLILDTVACAIGGRQSDLGSIAVRFAELAGIEPAEASIVGEARRATAVAAATANGRMAGALDADDTFASAGQTSHHGGSTVMGTLALAERVGASGQDLIAAVAAGYELGARFGIAVPPREVVPTAARAGSWRVGGGPAGVLSAALGCAHILGLDTEQTMHALGIAGAHIDMPPLKWFEAQTAPMVKSLDVGWNTGAGVSAALLASLGMTGHANILDGDTGLWRALGYESFDFDAVTGRLGERWYILDGSFKRWPCQYWIQPALTAFSRILEHEGLTADEIDSVVLRTNTKSGAARFREKQPEGFVTCQFNLPHPAAMIALGVPPGPRWFDDWALNAPEVRAFREKVDVEIEPEAQRAAEWITDGLIQRIPASAEVRANGRTFTARADAGLGAPWFDDTRLSDDDLRTKLDEMAVAEVWNGRTGAIADAVLSLEEVADVRELTALLRPGS